jgi:hypothetical protein
MTKKVFLWISVGILFMTSGCSNAPKQVSADSAPAVVQAAVQPVATPATRIDFVMHWKSREDTKQWAERGILSAAGGPNSDLLVIYFNPKNAGTAASMMSPAYASPEFSAIVSKLGFKDVLGIKLRADEAPSATISSDKIVYTGTAHNGGIKWDF